MKNLQVTFENLNNDAEVVTVNLSGRLNEMNAIDFKTDLMNILREKNADCLIDIRSLNAMDIIGINALVMAHRELELRGKKLTILSQSESVVDRAFHLTKFDKILQLQRA